MRDRNTVIKTIVFIVLVAALGVVSKMLPAWEGTWVSNHLAGAFYVVELSLILYLFFPEHFSVLLVTFAFLLTSLVEFFQNWHPAFLEPFRSTFVGHTILGSTFSWLDFPWYIAGAFIGWLLLQWIRPSRQPVGLSGK